MASGIPEIGVRLSAQGVSDVIQAFARVRQEAKKTGEEGGAGLGLITKAASSLTALLPAITFAAVAAGVARLAEGARATAEEIGKLSEKTGATVETLSALNLAAHDAEIDTDTLGKGIIKLARNMQDATDGAAKPQKAFKALGITLKDLKATDPGAMFVRVAQQLDKLPPGAQKAQVSIALFGKAGADLIPVLNSLGGDGFDRVYNKAKALGLLLDGPTVASARAAQDAFHELEDITAGLATRFVAGFSPNFTQSIDFLATELTGKGADGAKTFGDIAGKIFKALTLDVTILIDTLEFLFRSLTDGLKTSFGQALAFENAFTKTGSISAGFAAGSQFTKNDGIGYDARQKNRRQDLVDSIKRVRADAKTDATSGTGGRGGRGGGGTGNDEENASKLASAKAAYYQSLADNELAILKTKNELEEAEDKRHFDAGLLSVDDYYDKVEARINQSADAEIAVLRKKVSAAAALPQTTDEQKYKRLEDLAKIQTQIDEISLKRTGNLAASEDSRARAKHDDALKELQDEQKLQTQQGNTAAAAQTQLEIELQGYDEILKRKKDISAQDRQDLLDRARTSGEAKIGFDQNDLQLARDMQAMNQAIVAVQGPSQSRRHFAARRRDADPGDRKAAVTSNASARRGDGSASG